MIIPIPFKTYELFTSITLIDLHIYCVSFSRIFNNLLNFIYKLDFQLFGISFAESLTPICEFNK